MRKRHLALLLPTFAVLLLLAPHSSFAADIKIGPGDVKALVDLFSVAGMAAPSITINETASVFDLSIIGGPVQSSFFNDTQKFDTDFVAVLNGAEYWKGHIGFTTTHPQSIFTQDNDTVTVAGNIFHQAVNGQPHKTDDFAGGILTYSTLADAGTAVAPSIINGVPVISGTKDHTQNDRSSPHKDLYNGLLQATVIFENFPFGLHNNRISRFTFELHGNHVCSAPVGSLSAIAATDECPTSVPGLGSLALIGIGVLGVIGCRFLRKRSRAEGNWAGQRRTFEAYMDDSAIRS